MAHTESSIVHSVAFRVSEDQWLALQRYAEKAGLTIPEVARTALFERVGLETRANGRRRYGQSKRGSNTVKPDRDFP